VVCDEEGRFLCEKCIGKIVLIGRQTCPVCYQEGSAAVCEGCKGASNVYGGRADGGDGLRGSGGGARAGGADIFLDGLIAACRYENNPVVHKAIHEFKYNFIEDLAEPLGKLMAAALSLKISGAGGASETASARADANADGGGRAGGGRANGCDDFVLCPVPLHKKRLKWRGFNQAKLLADVVSGECELPVKEILERVKFKKPQMELKREERLKNVVDAFRIARGDGAGARCGAVHDVPGGGYGGRNEGQGSAIPQNIILVDDVATTLSTLNSCAKELKAAGAKIVYALVIARAVK
jgi:predicted amidophosphoribosyltransferase